MSDAKSGPSRQQRSRRAYQLRERGLTWEQIADVWEVDYSGINPRKAFRWAHDLTYEEVAERWNMLDPGEPTMTKSRIYEFEAWPEKGRRPSVENLRMLARIYNTTGERLLSRDEISRYELSSRSKLSAFNYRFYDDNHVNGGDGLRSGKKDRQSDKMSASAGAVIAPSSHNRPVIEALEVVSGDHLGGVVDNICELVNHYAQAVYAVRPKTIYDELRSVRAYASQIAERSQRYSRRSDIVVAAGWLSNLLAVVACDMGEHAAARVWCSDAENRSQESGYPDLAAWATLTKAMIAFYQGQPRQSVILASQGYKTAPAGTVINAKIAAQEMRAAAMIGDAARVARARRRAEAAIARLPSNSPTTGAFSIALGEDPPYTATSLLLLGNHSEAITATDRVLRTVYRPEAGQRGDNPSGYARALLIMALAHVSAGNLDEAVGAGHAALSGSRPAWPTMVLAGKLDAVLGQKFADAHEAGEYRTRYLEIVNDPIVS